MLDQVLGLEVGMGVDLRAGGMHHRQGALLVQRVELAQGRVEGEEAVEGEGLAGRHREARPRAVVGVVADRRDQAEAVRAAAQEHRHQGALLGPGAAHGRRRGGAGRWC